MAVSGVLVATSGWRVGGNGEKLQLVFQLH